MTPAGSLRSYLSLIKFSHTIFALPFALLGFFLATRQMSAPISWPVLVCVVLCMVFARSAAMAFNRYVDRRIDAANARTAGREIPAGVIRPAHALLFTLCMSAMFMATTWFINPLCFALSPVALAVVLGYSYTKRFTALCHLILGLGLALAPLGAWLAVTASFDIVPLLLGAAVLCWVSGFDIIYALQDISFDKQQRLWSIPAAVGMTRARYISIALHFCSMLCIIGAGVGAQVGLLYWVGAAFFAVMLLRQHALIKGNDLSRVNMAFFTSNGVASIIFASTAIIDSYWTLDVATI